jgi:hypothetical protein
MDNGFKTTVLAFGVLVLFGTAAVGCSGTDKVERTTESHHSETMTAAPAPAVVTAQPVYVAPAPVVVTHEHSSSSSSSSD